MKYAPKRGGPRDKNQKEITTALEKIGATVEDLGAVGDGCPDLLVGFRGGNYLIEVKMPKGKLNKKQKNWHWRYNGTVAVAYTVKEALAVVHPLLKLDDSL
jgi:hypothetical protein